MTILEDGTFEAGESERSYTATGTWSGNSPVGADLPDNQVWMHDRDLRFCTTYRFDLSDNGNTIILTAMIGNREVSTLTRIE